MNEDAEHLTTYLVDHMIDARDEPVEDDKEDAQNVDRVSQGVGNYRLMSVHFCWTTNEGARCRRTAD